MNILPQPTSFAPDADLEELLRLANSKYKTVFEKVKVGAHELEILQIADMEEYVDFLAENLPQGQKLELPFWAKIWPSSILLSFYLSRMSMAQNSTLLELGAGVGICGLFAAKQGLQVTISDYHEDALLFCQINILQNNLTALANVAKIDFTQERLPFSFRYILGSEILYHEQHYQPLINFMLQHLEQIPEAEVILAKGYQLKAEKFFQLAREKFNLQEKKLGYREQTPGDDPDQEKYLTQIFRMRPQNYV